MEIRISDNESDTSDLSEAEEDFFPDLTIQKMLHLRKNINMLVISAYTPVNPLLYNYNQVLIVL